jgi:hypothetical protein
MESVLRGGGDLATDLEPDLSGRSFTMAQKVFDQILEALRTGASDLGGRTGETVSQVSESVNRVLDEAGSEGAKIRRTLVRNWTSLEKPRRSRTIPVLLGILALGAATAYLVGRTTPSDSPG